MSKQKLIVILGPTATGKTDLSIKLAKEFNGEVVSADSKQIFKKMNIGTAKPQGKWEYVNDEDRYMVEGVPHYLIDIIDPGKDFSVADYKKGAVAKIFDIAKRGKVPLLVGGTGLYIWAVIENLDIPKSEANKKLRQSFEKKSCEDLAVLLSAIDPNAAIVDRNNKRRLIRALEVAITTGESFVSQRSKSEPMFDTLQIGLNWPAKELNERIEKRVDQQWQEGLVDEVKGLLKQNYIFEMSSMSSIGYRQVGYFLRGEMKEDEAIKWLKRDSRRYAKRQITWFKRDKKINWIDRNNYDEAKKLVKDFLK